MSARHAKSYGSIVAAQLRQNRLAMFGYRVILTLLLLAIYAPVIAWDRPFYYRGPDGVSFPWFADLFDRLIVRQPVDLFFNLAMFALPIGAVVFAVLRARLQPRDRWSFRARRWTWGVLSLLYLWTFVGIAVPDAWVRPASGKLMLMPGSLLRSSKPVVDYHTLAAEAEQRGEPVAALFPPIPYGYGHTRVRESVLPPDYFVLPSRKDLGAVGKHPLGTDPGGRDVFAALLYGTRISMTIGVLAVAIYVSIGVVLGCLAGYFGGWVDMVVSRLTEVMICFPTLFFVLAIVAVFEKRSIFLVMGAIGITGWTGVSRLVRGEVLTQRSLEYTTAARALGASHRRIMFGHILQNSLSPVLVTATFGIAGAILVESSISFLGLGDTTAASWGLLLSTGRQTNLDWLILAPGMAIFVTVTAFNLLGEGLRDALDPKLRK